MKIKIFGPRLKKGFTFIELILAVFVLEIGLLGIAGFYTYSLSVTKQARNQTTASNLATGLLDEKLAISYDNLLPIGEGEKTPYSTDPETAFGNFYKQVDIAWIDANLTASYTQSESNKDMKKITVTVYWHEGTPERSFQIATIKADH